jgi:hypothetical protein
MLRSDGLTPIRDMMPILQQLGVGLVLRPNQGQHGTIFVLGNRATKDDAVPSVVLTAEHYNMLARLTQHGTPVKAETRRCAAAITPRTRAATT